MSAQRYGISRCLQPEASHVSVHLKLKNTHSACRRCKQIIATPR